MRILGIDCGTQRTGYGLIESDGRRHTFVNAGVIATHVTDDLSVRLAAIASELRRLIGSFCPEAVAVEEVFHSINSKSALKLAHVRGVVLLLAAEAGVPVSEYSPLSIKMSVTGYGRAEKQQVGLMVRSLLDVQTAAFATFDASDALAVAICHANLCMQPRAVGDRA